MYLYFNTTNHREVKIALLDASWQEVVSTEFFCEYQFQIKDELLKSVAKLLKKKKFLLKDLDSIVVVQKSKEMTSLRIGIAAANALAYSLNIPVVGIKKANQLDKIKKIEKFKPVVPEYEINPMLSQKNT